MEKKDLTIILVHGAWADGSHWSHIIPTLIDKGYSVRAVQLPLTSLADDVQKTKDLIEAQDGKALLVGHSYGGAVITSAGNHERVVGLVYLAAFAPDQGESLNSLLSQRPTPGMNGIAPDSGGLQLWYDYAEYQQGLCADVNTTDAMVMALCQRPIHSRCIGDAMDQPAWKNLPAWYQVSANDNILHPDTQRAMSIRMNAKEILELETSHASLASKSKEVSALIIKAASTLV